MRLLGFNQFWFSLWESALTVTLALGIGGSIALLEHYWRARHSKIFTVAMMTPVFLPTVMVATGFIAVYGQAGYLNELLATVGIAPRAWLYSAAAVIASHSLYNIPLAYVAIRLRLDAASLALEETARLLGGYGWNVFLTATWPRLRAAVIGVSTLIFLYSFMSFSLPLILGGLRYQTLEVYLYTLVTQQFNLEQATLLALLQWLFLSLLIVLMLPFLKTIGEPTIYRVSAGKLSLRRRLSLTLLHIVMGLFVLGPVVAVWLRGGQAQWLNVLFAETAFLPALWRTLIIAAIVVTITLIGALILTLKLKPTGSQLSLLLLALSPVTVGIFLRLWWTPSLFLLTIAYCLLLLPFCWYALAMNWQAKPPRFLETVALLGANHRQRLLASARLLLPTLFQLVPLGFAFVLGDLAATSVLAPYRQPTVMNYSYGLIGAYRFPLAATALSTVLIVIIFILVICLSARHYYFNKLAR